MISDRVESSVKFYECHPKVHYRRDEVVRYDKDVYRDRNIVFSQFLLKYYDGPLRILDIAGECGYLAKTLLDSGLDIETYCMIDQSPEMCQMAKEYLAGYDVNVVCMDANTLTRDFCKGFNCFVSSSFEHLSGCYEIVSCFPEGSFFCFSVPDFGLCEHYLRFTAVGDFYPYFSMVLSLVDFDILQWKGRQRRLFEKITSFLGLNIDCDLIKCERKFCYCSMVK